MTGISPIVDEPANKLYPTCSIKRVRRTKDNLQEILTACQSIIQEEGTVSLRHLFYRVVSVGLIEKTEPEYPEAVRLYNAVAPRRIDPVVLIR